MKPVPQPVEIQTVVPFAGRGLSDLAAKLDVFDAFADAAVSSLIVSLVMERQQLVALARGRHIEGHYRFGDRNLLEYDAGELAAETAQELADAIVYRSRTLYQAAEGSLA